MAGKQNKVTLSTDDLGKLIDEIKAIDVQLAGLKGTAAEWNKKGQEAARATATDEFVGSDVMKLEFLVGGGITVGEHIDAVRSYLEDAEQFGNELMVGWIKANRTDGDESTALKSRREALVTDAESRRNIFAQLLGPDSVAEFEIPKAAKSSGGGGSTAPKKDGSMTFYRVIDGERVPQSKDQDSLSSLAYYNWKRPVADLRAALVAQHGKVDETVDWEGPATLVHAKKNEEVTVTIGWYKVKADEPAADAPKDDAPKDEEVKAD